MFRDCKSGGTALGGCADLKQVPCGYNLEGCHVIEARLSAIVLLIAIVYTSPILQGINIRKLEIERYVCRLKEPRRIQRRHSNFWVGMQ